MLLDPAKRAQYDAELRGGGGGGGGGGGASGYGGGRGAASAADFEPDFARSFFSSFFGGSPFGGDPFWGDPFQEGAPVASSLRGPLLRRGRGGPFDDFFGFDGGFFPGADPFAAFGGRGGGGGPPAAATFFASSSSSFSSRGGAAVERSSSSRSLPGGITETRVLHRRTRADGTVETLEDSVTYRDRSGREVPPPRLAVQGQRPPPPSPPPPPPPPQAALPSAAASRPASQNIGALPRTNSYGGAGGGGVGGGGAGGGYYAPRSFRF